MTRKYAIGMTLLCGMLALSACKENREMPHKLLINEVMLENTSNFQDDYGMHNPWIEIYNQSYATVDLAGAKLRHSDTPGDTVTYFIPKGDLMTRVGGRQHLLFWADGMPNRGTFHTNFKVSPDKENWFGLFDEGNKLLNEVVVPAGLLTTDHSYARVTDGSKEWEVKGGEPDKYVTPSTNNKTLDSNAKMQKFTEHDSNGVGMTITAMGVVFLGLLLLYLVFRTVGKASIKLSNRNAKTKSGEKVKSVEEVPGATYAAIALALHEMLNDAHDDEETVLTITRVKRSYSPWSSKIYNLREVPTLRK